MKISRLWLDEFTEPVLSIYSGTPDASADYDKMEAAKTLKLESFGGTQPTPYPDGGVCVVRGEVQMPETGVYEFRPGYGASAENIMLVDGKEVYRKLIARSLKEMPRVRLVIWTGSRFGIGRNTSLTRKSLRSLPDTRSWHRSGGKPSAFR